jgi:hypothetical protein
MEMFPFDDTLWFPVVSKISDVGILKPPKFDEENNMWVCTFIHNETKETKKTWGDDAPTCIIRLFKFLFPGIKPW